MMNEKNLSAIELDSLIGRLTSEKQGRDVKMAENEIKGVCQMSREIFLSQPMLL
jgi:Serine-threonine protein phosphatase N-terminal domain